MCCFIPGCQPRIDWLFPPIWTDKWFNLIKEGPADGLSADTGMSCCLIGVGLEEKAALKEEHDPSCGVQEPPGASNKAMSNLRSLGRGWHKKHRQCFTLYHQLNYHLVSCRGEKSNTYQNFTRRKWKTRLKLVVFIL